VTDYDAAAVERVARVKREVTERLLALPGVNLVAIGGKETGGRPTGELVVQVWVDEKLPLSEIPPEQRIPEEIDGVKTDVYVGGRKVLLAADGAFVRSDDTDGKRYRPSVPGGSRIKAENASGKGTMGCILHDPADVEIAYGLTNHHVIQPPGDPARPRAARRSASRATRRAPPHAATTSSGRSSAASGPTRCAMRRWSPCRPARSSCSTSRTSATSAGSTTSRRPRRRRTSPCASAVPGPCSPAASSSASTRPAPRRRTT